MELLVEKLEDSGTCCRPSKTFFRQGGIEQHSDICSPFILLKEKVLGEIERSVVSKVHC